ncbi:MAG: VOC family protein [Acidimicrobiaceae bacterium]|jgi:glyoxylase I family protein|nr:VOC family protein [Acidimicrobiaceae bacterium]MCH9802181.1 VOC family protein [bacterium]MDC1389171.1 VOC family protein [Acidimicrobiales bacterium]MBT6446557.1 VOC family protein [Acidimicrobiaceae bacterium]MCO4834688.1 VOC family protein [Acidimicrobiaceae bacterium]
MLSLRKNAIDLGIVIKDSNASLAFYRDLLGFEHVADTPLSGAVPATMHRLRCGDTMIKLVSHDETPSAEAPPGGIGGATGIRYFTMQITNLAEATNACRDAGVKVIIDQREIRPGVSISMVADPDGNWVEFVDDTTL